MKSIIIKLFVFFNVLQIIDDKVQSNITFILVLIRLEFNIFNFLLKKWLERKSQ